MVWNHDHTREGWSMLAFEINFDIVTILFDNGSIEELRPGSGPGFWKRALDQLRLRGHIVDPADFSPFIELLYFGYAPAELRDDAVRRERLGYFICPRCNCIYAKREFKHFDPCDNCRWGSKP